jgi:hypothetical protein
MTEKVRVCLIRPLPHGIDRENDFVNGIISLGYPLVDDLREKQKILSKEEIMSRAKEPYGDRNISLVAHQIHNFATLPIGSIVVTPSLKSRDLHFLETVGEYYFEPDAKDDEIGNPHQIKVKLLKTVPRIIFSAAFQSMLNAAKKAVTEISGTNRDEALKVASEDILTVTAANPLAQKIERTLLDLLSSNNSEIRHNAALELLEIGSEASKLKAVRILTSKTL